MHEKFTAESVDVDVDAAIVAAAAAECNCNKTKQGKTKKISPRVRQRILMRNEVLQRARVLARQTVPDKVAVLRIRNARVRSCN